MNVTLKRWLISVGTVLAVIAIIFFAIVWIVRSSFPQTRGSLQAKGLQADLNQKAIDEVDRAEKGTQ